MDSKKAIKKAISLAVLSALVQNNQINGLGLNKLIDFGKDYKVFKLCKRGVERCYFGSKLGTGSVREDGLVALGHMFNSCWVNTAVSSVMSQLTANDIRKIEEQLENYEMFKGYEIITGEVNNDKVNNDKVNNQDQQNELAYSMGLLRLFIDNIKEIRWGNRQRVSEKLQKGCDYDGVHGGSPFRLFEGLKPALEYCGFELKITNCNDIPTKVEEWVKDGCKKYVVIINDTEPNGHPHVYFEFIDLDKEKCYEINDMTGRYFKGYVKALDSNTAKTKIAKLGFRAYAIMPKDQKHDVSDSNIDFSNSLLSEFKTKAKLEADKDKNQVCYAPVCVGDFQVVD